MKEVTASQRKVESDSKLALEKEKLAWLREQCQESERLTEVNIVVLRNCWRTHTTWQHGQQLVYSCQLRVWLTFWRALRCDWASLKKQSCQFTRWAPQFSMGGDNNIKKFRRLAIFSAGRKILTKHSVNWTM